MNSPHMSFVKMSSTVPRYFGAGKDHTVILWRVAEKARLISCTFAQMRIWTYAHMYTCADVQGKVQNDCCGDW